MSTAEHDPDTSALSDLRLDSGPGPALALSTEAQQAVVAAALQRAYAEGLLRGPGATGSAVARERSAERRKWQSTKRQRRNVGVVVVGLCLASAAAAAVKTFFFDKQQSAPDMVAGNVVKVDDSVASVRLPEAVVAVPATPVNSGAEVPATKDETVRVSPAAASTQGPQLRARDLLEQANRLRRARRFRDAVGVYREVEGEYPSTLQAQTARIAAAELLLSQLNDPGSAEQLYSKALRSGGALAPEAAFGLAEVYRRRGETGKAADAFRDFAQRYPQSPLADLAQRRLKGLQGLP